MAGYAEAFQSATDTSKSEYENKCSNPSSQDCTDYVKAQSKNFLDEQTSRKNNAMSNALAVISRVYDADRSSAYAMARTDEMIQQIDAINLINKGEVDSYTTDIDVTRRQFEINEYHYQNKLETLFFLQLLFISVLVMSILVYFNRTGALTAKMTGILTTVFAVVLVIVGVSRYFYTERTRDRRLWHRRYFKKENEPKPDLIKSCAGPSAAETEINLNALFDAEDISCAVETNANFKAWQTAAEEEAKKQQQTSAMPTSIFANTGLETGKSCKRRR